MLLSKRCVYGIRATLFMASRSRASFVSAREISRKLGISEHYLPKVLQDLTRAGITRSYRGPNGGVSLSRPPSEITLSQIIRALEGLPSSTDCPLAIDDCRADTPCTFCNRWISACNQLDGLFEDTTIADVQECTNLDTTDATRVEPAESSRTR